MKEQVRSLDHTADVGLEIQAPDLPRLFELAARGLVGLLRGDDSLSETATDIEGLARSIELKADDPGSLLVGWLRELLFLHGVEGLTWHGAVFEDIAPDALRARVLLHPDEGPLAREIKGVTYHGLRVEPADGGWYARVIFDV